MKIRKTFAFEGAHVVRGCSTERCATSIHGHSYQVELYVAADRPDHGQMVVDFGLLKGAVRDCVEAFDHTLAYWKGDDPAYLEAMRTHSRRWIGLPVSPSAEQLSRVLFLMVEFALGRLERRNGEGFLRLEQVVLHETATGCALCDRDAAHDPAWTTIRLEEIDFSPLVLAEDGSGILTAMHGPASHAACARDAGRQAQDPRRTAGSCEVAAEAWQAARPRPFPEPASSQVEGIRAGRCHDE